MDKHKRAKMIASRSLMVALGLMIGVLIAAQWRSLPVRVSNPIAPYSSLKETKEALYEEQDQLKSEIKDLQLQIERAQKDSEDIGLSKQQISELNYKKAQAGLTKLNGAGLIITYDDSSYGSLSADSIVHAGDLRDTVNALWGAGAEGISINGQRIVTNTAIDCIVNTILVNNTRISNPFRIEAIGNPDELYSQISNPRILTSVHDRKRDQGLIFEISKNQDITLPVYDGSFEVKTNLN
ncbi:MAG: DUF881 domain-containing protein [Patescibacteria group bacterium]|jgi:uncharacterized protein YlxW (UPF0749 family)